MARMKGNTLDFSFSGLKTAVLYALAGAPVAKVPPPPPGPQRADLAASFPSGTLKLEDLVDGLNRRVKGPDPVGPSRWLLERLKN